MTTIASQISGPPQTQVNSQGVTQPIDPETLIDDINALIDEHQELIKDFSLELSEAKISLYNYYPFWAMLVESSPIYASLQIPTAAMDNFGRMYINLAFWKKLDTRQRVYLLAHEVCHFMLRHYERQGKRKPTKWNFATDYAINFMLTEDMGPSAMPPGGLHDHNYGTMTAEQIYDKIPDPPEDGGGYGGGGKGGSCAAGGDDMIGNGNIPTDAQQIAGAGDNTPQMSEEIKVKLSQALARAKMQGLAPAAASREIDRMMKPQIDWRDELDYLITNSVTGPNKSDFDMLPPSRRFIHMGWYFPAQTASKGPKIVYAIDTSGSMHPDDLNQAISELQAIREHLNARVYLMDCDAQVYAARYIEPNEDLPVKVVGGGGTSFRPVFEHIEDQELEPDCLVFFTDTWGCFPDEEPNYPVIWVCPHQDPEVPWGRVISIPPTHENSY